MSRSLPTFLLLLTLLPTPAAAQAPLPPPAGALAAADKTLATMDVDGACRLWVGLLAAPQPYPTIARLRLARWLDHCRLGEKLDELEDAVFESEGSPLFVWQMHDLARKALKKYRKDDRAQTHTPRILRPLSSRWYPSPAPVTAAFAAVPLDRPDLEVADTPGVGMVARAEFCFAVTGTTVRYVRLELPNPAVVHFNGELLDSLGPDGAQVFPQARHYALLLEPGTHCLEVVQAAVVGGVNPAVKLLPSLGVEPVSRGPEHVPPSWKSVEDRFECREGAPVCDWYDVASEHIRGERADALTDGALASPLRLMLYLAYLNSPANLSAGKEEDELSILESYVSLHEDCHARLHLLSRRLELGEDAQADLLLEALDPECRETAVGILLVSQFAQYRQWTAVHDALLDGAHDRFGDDCEVLSRWYERQLELGRSPSVEEFPVSCGSVLRARRDFLARSGSAPQSDEDPEKEYFESPYGRRLAVLGGLAGGDSSGPDKDLLARLLWRDPQVSWELTDVLLSRGQTAEAEESAAQARAHRSTWGPVRSLAGNVFFWNQVLPYLDEPEDVIRSYLERVYDPDLPRITVLDEMVAIPDKGGWITLVVTEISHLVSPDAAESVGEIDLSPEEEILDLSVRKADGSYMGPEELMEAGAKDTISIPGLATGDILIKRTIQEVPAGRGSCYALPAFYFGHNELPVFRSRLVVVAPREPVMRFVVNGDVTHEEPEPGTHLFTRMHIDPVPTEPLCPEAGAGLPFVYAHTECFSWAGIRDKFGDSLVGHCNASLPEELESSGGDPLAIFRYVVRNLEGEGLGLADVPFSEQLRTGRGNLVMGLYCALIQAGHDAHIVAVNSPSAQPLDLDRPGLGYFDGLLVYVAGDHPRWLDPFDRRAPAPYLRPAARNRPAIILTPLHPKLFVRTPADAGEDLWDVEVEAGLDDEGNLSGELSILAIGSAAVDLDRSFRDTTEARNKKMAQALLTQFLPTAASTTYELGDEGDDVRVRINFQGQVPATGEARLLLLAPPMPDGRLAQLADRMSPLWFPGFSPMRIHVRFTADSDWSVRANEMDETIETEFGTLSQSVSLQGNRVEMTKTVRADPLVVRPADYHRFVKFIARIARLSAVPVQVTYGENR